MRRNRLLFGLLGGGLLALSSQVALAQTGTVTGKITVALPERARSLVEAFRTDTPTPVEAARV